jgi:hypothetical protein
LQSEILNDELASYRKVGRIPLLDRDPAESGKTCIFIHDKHLKQMEEYLTKYTRLEGVLPDPDDLLSDIQHMTMIKDGRIIFWSNKDANDLKVALKEEVPYKCTYPDVTANAARKVSERRTFLADYLWTVNAITFDLFKYGFYQTSVLSLIFPLCQSFYDKYRNNGDLINRFWKSKNVGGKGSQQVPLSDIMFITDHDIIMQHALHSDLVTSPNDFIYFASKLKEIQELGDKGVSLRDAEVINLVNIQSRFAGMQSVVVSLSEVQIGTPEAPKICLKYKFSTNASFKDLEIALVYGGMYTEDTGDVFSIITQLNKGEFDHDAICDEIRQFVSRFPRSIYSSSVLNYYRTAMKE